LFRRPFFGDPLRQEHFQQGLIRTQVTSGLKEAVALLVEKTSKDGMMVQAVFP
jgi:hypothetical protein